MFLLLIMYPPKRYRPYQWLTSLNLGPSPFAKEERRPRVTLFDLAD
jgi:hypothetical protein